MCGLCMMWVGFGCGAFRGGCCLVLCVGFVHNMTPSGGVGFWVGFFVWVSGTCWVLVFVRISILDGLLVVMICLLLWVPCVLVQYSSFLCSCNFRVVGGWFGFEVWF